MKHSVLIRSLQIQEPPRAGFQAKIWQTMGTPAMIEMQKPLRAAGRQFVF